VRGVAYWRRRGHDRRPAPFGGDRMPGDDEPARPRPLPEENYRHGRLTVRAGPPVAPATRTGLVSFDGPAGDARALAYVPGPVDDGPYRLAVLLHGAGGAAGHALQLLRGVADAERLLLVAPQSVGRTWDLVVGGFGPDVPAIHLQHVEVVPVRSGRRGRVFVGARKLAGVGDVLPAATAQLRLRPADPLRTPRVRPQVSRARAGSLPEEPTSGRRHTTVRRIHRRGVVRGEHRSRRQ
jgi:hypothetical protein